MSNQGQIGTYTSPNGQTVPGQAMDQANSAWASMANAQPLNPQQLQQTTQGLTKATGDLAASQTPQVRQNYVNNGDIPAIQNNYDSLAKQLYDIDKSIASSGQYNSTPPPDALSSPGVAASPLALTNSILSGNSFSSPNPQIGLQSKLVSNNSVIDLLNTLNDSLGKELNSRKNTYASTVKGQQSVVDAFMKVLDKNSDIGMERYKQGQENYRAGLSASASKKSSLSTRANQLRSDLATGVLQWGDAWKQLRAEAGADVPDAEIDSYLGGKYDASDPDGTKGKTTGWARPGAAEDYASGLRYKASTSKAAATDFTPIINGVTTYLQDFNKTGGLDRFNPGSSSKIKIENQRKTLGQMVAKLIENNRLSNQDRQFYVDLLPSSTDPFMLIPGNADAKVQGFMDAISSNLKNPDDMQVFQQLMSTKGGGGGGAGGDWE